MSDKRLPKQALNYIPQNRRKGRPMISWKHKIENIMKDKAIEEDEMMKYVVCGRDGRTPLN